MQQDERAGIGLERHEIVGGVGLRVEGLHPGFGEVGGHPIPGLHRDAMTARVDPETAVLQRGVFDGEPEADHRLRFGPEERVVAMETDLTSDTGLLEDVHRLEQLGVAEAEIGGDRCQLRCATKGLERRVEVVHGVAEFVDREPEGHGECPIHDGAVLEEPADLVAGVEKPLVVAVRLLGRIEDGEARPIGGVDLVEEPLDVGLQFVAALP